MHRVSELRYEERDEAAGPEPDEAAARRGKNRHVRARVLRRQQNSSVTAKRTDRDEERQH